MGLLLKKDCAGYYSNQVGSIRVAVSNSYDKKEWSGVIENQKAETEEEFLIFKCFGKTKKEVIKQIENFLQTL